MRNKKIKILRVIARLNIGGPAIHTVLLTSALNDGHFQTMLVTGKVSDQEGDMAYLANKHQVKPTYIPQLQREISLIKDIKAGFALWKILNQFKPDIIHTHTAKAGMLGRFCALFYNLLHKNQLRLVHTYHGHVFHGYFSPLKTKLFIYIERFLAKFTNRIITITQLQQKEILSFGVGRSKQHKVVPLGLDLRKFYDAPRHGESLRKKYNIDKHKVLIGTVARFVPIKNLALFMRTAKLLCTDRDDVHFILVGDGEEKEKLYRLAEELGLLAHTTFTGFLEDLPEVYSDLDIMMLTSKNEGSPVSIIEAMTSGVPVVASKVGGVADLYLKSGKKWLCESGNANSFKEAIDHILSNPTETSKIVAEHKEAIFNKYNFHRLVDDLIYEYKTLLS